MTEQGEQERLGLQIRCCYTDIAWRKHLGGTYTMHYEGREFIVRIIRMKTKTRMTGVDANGLPPRVGVKLSVAARLLDSGGATEFRWSIGAD